MGDAVRRVQRHLQELSRDHLTSVEDRHHANLGWLQIELQQLCKQIEVEVRVELTRPPRLSFSKALLPVANDARDKPALKNDASSAKASAKASDSAKSAAPADSSAKPRVLPSPVNVPATRLLDFDAIEEEASPRASKKRRLEDMKKAKPTEAADTKEAPKAVREVIDVDLDSDVEVLAVVPPPSKRMVKRIVTRTRKVLKPKQIVKTEKKFIKEEKPRLPQVDVDVLKVVDLKSELKKRGLKQTGVKAVLVKRLQAALDGEDAAQSKDDLDEGTWVTQEVVEEVMEEVEEEYQVEIEEEEFVQQVSATETVDPKKTQHSQAVTVDGAVNSKASEGSSLNDAAQGTAREAEERERGRLSGEDNDAPTGVDQSQVTKAANTSVSLRQPSPKISLSEMETPMSGDEIVRESADGFISPEGKMLSTQAASAHKSPGKKVQPGSASSRLPSIVEAKPTALEAPTVPFSTTTASQIEPAASASTNVASRSVSEPGTEVTTATSTNKVEEKHRSKSAPQTSSIAGTVQASQGSDKDTMDVVISNLPTTDNASLQLPRSLTKTPVDVSNQDSQQVPNVAKEFTTPSRDLMERVKSLASSSRSSSISSLTAARRYTGSISYVEDSQPSPHQSSFMTETSTLPNRAASISQMEIQARAFKAKTPDSGSAVPPPSERVAQSEPKVNVAKLEVEDEATRKRREQQENIQREAQRIRLAMKQTAKKRFEESKTTKRDNTKEENHVEGPVSAQTSPVEQVSSSVPSPQSSVEPNPVRLSQPISQQKSMSTEKLVSGSGVEMTKKAPLNKPSTATALPAEGERPAASVIRTQPSSSTLLAKKETEKRSVPTRKRPSIVLDSSTSTLYPSKKRTSLQRTKDAEPTIKRTSLTRTSSPAQSVPKRTSLTRTSSPAGSVPKRTSLTRTSSPAGSVPKRTSTERAPGSTVAPKRKRSSVTDEKPVVATASGKRKSSSLSQTGQPGTRTIATASSSIPQKTSKTTTRTGIPSSVVAKRRDSASSTISSSSSVSTSDARSKPTTSVLSGGAVRRPANLVSGIHSFTTLLEKDSANLSSSQGSNTSSSRQAPSVGALKLAEKSRLLEQKKNLEKAKRKEALAKRYEEQRKADEEKRKKYALMKEKAEREARSKREQEQAMEKKQRDIELAKKRQQRLQEIRSGMKKPQGTEKDQAAPTKAVAPVSRVAGATSSSSTQVTKNPAKAPHAQSNNKEVTTYVMSENEESSESEDEKDTERNSKNIPKWAQRENLERTLRIQFGPNAIDPTPSIFPDFVDTCDLEAIFEPTDVRKKKRFQRRTSSGNWLGDRPTAREKAVYKKDMGFSR